MIEAHFTSIKNILLQELNQTKEDIIVAVAWFTHRSLYTSILEALDRGVKVSVILIDDMINRGELGLNWNTFIEKGGCLYFANSRKSLMHDKFCVLDKNIVISGSYNWTYSADKRNSENIIITDDSSVVKDFTDHFKGLLNGLQFCEKFTPWDTTNADYSDFMRDIDDMEDEINAMKDEDIIDESVLAAIENLKSRTSIIRMCDVRETNNRSKPKLRHNIGMRCNIKDVSDKVLHIIEKGQSLPYSNIVKTKTAVDNQNTIRCDIVYGDSENADENQSLIDFSLTNIPILKKGEAQFNTKVTVDTNGYLHVEEVCINNGVAKETYGMHPKIVKYE